VPRVAHIFALAGVLSVSATICRPDSIPAFNSDSLFSQEKTLVIFPASDAAMTPEASLEMEQELGHLLEAAAIRVEWRDRAVDRGSVENDYSAVVHLRGSCRPAEPSIRFEHAASGTFTLASSAVADGVILPFGDIDCAALNSFLGPMLWKEPAQARELIYARAVARLMAHELYHVIGQTHEHARSGIAEPSFTVAELLSDHFEFTEAALTELPASPAADEYSVWTDAGVSSGK
jgi:hypothetical protein